MEKAVEFMDSYSINMDDFDTIVEISKFQVGVVIERFSCIFMLETPAYMSRMDFWV